jgi:pimeloyl-ACP methyl ester carboxylesterase
MTFEEAARPFDIAGSTDLGLLVVHGFTSTPGSMLELAQALNTAGGWTAALPLLPAHGTVWTDLNKVRWQAWEAAVEAAYQALAKRCKRVAVVGLSLGGALTLNLATKHPELAGLVLVNHLIFFDDIRVPFAPLIRLLLPGVPAVAGDIKAPGVKEPAYAMTPEKLQGVTLDNELYVSILDNRSPQILYVVFSRVRALINLILTERLTLEYVRKFLPPKEIILLMKQLIDKIQLPSYASPEVRHEFATWQRVQTKYAKAALDLHDYKVKSRMALRKLVLNK